MCPCETVVRIRRCAAATALAVALLAVSASQVRAQSGQNTVNTPAGNGLWKKIAGYTVSQGLAGPASGPVKSVWYSQAGNRLLVQTAAGRIFETSDFEHWRLNTSDTVPDRATPAAPPLITKLP